MVDMSDPENYRRVLLAREGREAAVGAADDSSGADQRVPIELVRVEVEPDPTLQGTLGPADLLERFTDRVDELGAAVSAIAERLRASLEARLSSDESSRWWMSEVGMEFSLNLEAETGIIVCKGKTAAAFKVSIKWAGDPTKRAPHTG